MCLRRRPFSSLWFWIFLALLPKNRVASRSSQHASRLSDQNIEGISLKIKGEIGQSMQHQTESDPSKDVENRLASRNPQPQTSRLSDQNSEARSLKLKGEIGDVQSMLDRTISDPQDFVSCNCSDFCPHSNISELQKLIWIENNPIFCKESGRLDIDKKPYLAACFFFCCRKCNGEYHKCVLTTPRESCLKAAYACAGICLKESSLKITVKGW